MGTDETRVGENVSVGKKKIRHSVIDEINAAFSDLPYPGDPSWCANQSGPTVKSRSPSKDATGLIWK